MNVLSIVIVEKLNSPDDIRVRDVVDVIHTVSKRLSIPVIPRESVNPFSFVIAVGGDGTMLEAMRIAAEANAVAVGINLGKVGFLTDFSADAELGNVLIDVLTNHHQYLKERRIGINIMAGPRRVPAFNEYVISNQENDRIIHYTLKIGDMDAGTHRATSLIISVPTGSTAYSLSAGGGLILPSMEVFQIIPLAPLSMTSRPIIVPASLPITVKFETVNNLSVKADGQEVIRTLSPLELTFIQHSKAVQILHNKDWNFFNMLTNKLGWQA